LHLTDLIRQQKLPGVTVLLFLVFVLFNATEPVDLIFLHLALILG